MKVLLVLEATLGGSGRHVLDLAKGLLGSGEEVHLVCSRLRADHAFVDALDEMQRTSTRFHVREVPMRREVALADIRSFFALARYVRRNSFDVIHSHSTKAGFLARLLPTRGGAVSIYTPHGLMTQNPNLRGVRRWAVAVLESVLSRACGQVIAVSEIERECAIRTGIVSDRLTVIPNGLNAGKPKSRHEVRAQLGLSPDTVCIGSIGLLVANKEHARLLDAFANLRNRTQVPCCLVVVGWGPAEADLRQRAAQIGLAESVRFLGQVSGYGHLPAFDILAHTSRYEGFAYTFLEALNTGTPIVTTKVGGAPETVLHSVNGFICDPWNAETFAKHLLSLVEDAPMRRAMSEKAKEHAAHFTADSMVQATLDCYQRLTGHPRRIPNRNHGLLTGNIQ